MSAGRNTKLQFWLRIDAELSDGLNTLWQSTRLPRTEFFEYLLSFALENYVSSTNEADLPDSYWTYRRRKQQEVALLSESVVLEDARRWLEYEDEEAYSAFQEGCARFHYEEVEMLSRAERLIKYNVPIDVSPLAACQEWLVTIIQYSPGVSRSELLEMAEENNTYTRSVLDRALRNIRPFLSRTMDGHEARYHLISGPTV